MALTDNLINYWKLDEAAGATVTDTVSADNGTATNMEDGDWTAGKNNNALNFGGTDEYVQLNNSANWQFLGDWSLNFWIKTTSNTTSPISKDNDAGGDRQFLFFINANTAYSSVWVGGAEKNITGTVTLNDNAWHMCTLTYKSIGAGTSEYRYYTDGAADGVPLTNLNTPCDYKAAALLNFGRRQAGSLYYTGLLDEVAIWNGKALTQAEITQLYNGGTGLFYPFAVAPVADFTGTPVNGYEPLSVAFTDSSSNTPTSWAWNFGDGETSVEQNPTHVYNTSASFTVTLTATNVGGSDGETKVAYITVSEQPSINVYPPYKVGCKELKTSWDSLTASDSTKKVGHKQNLVAEQGTFVSRRDQVGIDS